MKPLIVILASPSPPPVCVAYTPGVEFNTIGISCEASSSLIFLTGIDEKATGVSLSLAISATTSTSFNKSVFNLKSKLVISLLISIVKLTSSYPTYEIFKLLVPDCIEKK